MICIKPGICSIGKNTPERKIIGKVKVIIIIIAVSCSAAIAEMRMPNPIKEKTPRNNRSATKGILPYIFTPKRKIERSKTIDPCNRPLVV
ncbi:unnamed protein product [marine sediment metagenome]|uniref:Uncharacterized protein n=1 Tax=marine sediment metagenome TaxID=412755 RepID=X1ITU8_9ZZZZ